MKGYGRRTGSLVHIVFVLTVVAVLAHMAESKQRAKPRRPNIVVLMTDDQDVMLGTMDFMEKTKQEVINRGTTFKNAFTTSPICCPSRSSFLTGLYAHNHNVLTNTLLCGSQQWRETHESRTFAKYLNDSGYETGYFGKYLNEYKGDYIPEGWNNWQGLVKNSRYYNYTICNNGVREHHRDNYHEDYLTDLVVNRSISFFRQAKRDDRERPVLSMLSFPAPHGPEAGAPPYQGMFANVTSHITPSYNYGPNPDKHWIMRQNKNEMDSTQHYFSQMLQQKRLQTLMSVDDAVEKFIDMLREIGELDNTYVLYTSDHGFHIGQFRLAKGKSMPYDFDTRVPFYLRGPGIPSDSTLNEIVLNVDVAPTILALAGVEQPEHMDGRNFIPLIKNRKAVSPPWRDRFLIERGKVPKKCKPTEPSKHAKLRQMCLTKRDEYGYPCKAKQANYCVHNNVTGEFRMKKCRSPPKKKKCKCAGGSSGNSTIKLSKKEKALRLKCHKKFINFQTLATEYALSEVGTYISRALLSGGSPKRRGGRQNIRHRRSVMRKLRQKNRKRRGTKSKAQKGGKMRTQNTFRALRYRELFSFDSCKHEESKEQRKQCTYFVKILRSYIKKLHFNVRKDINNAMNRIRKRIDKDIFKRCLDVFRPPCTCSQQLTPHNNNNNDNNASAKPNSKTTVETPLVAEDHAAGDTPVPRKVKRRKQRPKGASRNCANVNSTNTITGMTCFRLDHNKWVTPPTWAGDERCYCTNSNNNTYWCMRVINETADQLYCVFVTNFVEFYDMKIEPNQLINTYSEQPLDKISVLHNDLKRLSKCNGSEGNSSCHVPRGGFNMTSNNAEGGDNNDFCGQKSTSSATFDQIGMANVDEDEEDIEDDIRDDPDEELPLPEQREENNEENYGDGEPYLDTDRDGRAIGDGRSIGDRPAIGDRWRGYFQNSHSEEVAGLSDQHTSSEATHSE